MARKGKQRLASLTVIGHRLWRSKGVANLTMQHVAKLRVRFPSHDIARAVVAGLKPDNIDPKGRVQISAGVVDDTLELKFVTWLGVDTLVSTVDDALSCLHAAETTLNKSANTLNAKHARKRTTRTSG